MGNPAADAWDYDVTDRGINYVVRIDDNHKVRHVLRLHPPKDWPAPDRRTGEHIWADCMVETAPMPRQARRAIQAARIIEREENRKIIKDQKMPAEIFVEDVLWGVSPDEDHLLWVGRRPGAFNQHKTVRYIRAEDESDE